MHNQVYKGIQFIMNNEAACSEKLFSEPLIKDL